MGQGADLKFIDPLAYFISIPLSLTSCATSLPLLYSPLPLTPEKLFAKDQMILP